uniref:3-oxo-5-alpha-steroid 4-dehydrogenase C-terminal domain-containing protein n=1 Tax=Chlamydomonas leiostraca TaxID=1034604 RepID=A0A7S0S5L9_9CHLO|mmetsp:Transcript_9860/g.24618  ORF Transcript_9860/g.24618 Transcript_9860/m.24618 type:complete len:350 (+) Transcript_9860:135-1184(+)|eukprot:CAMPEP_0202862784 /NCGR_PEP_ID=MMETSP1391-20130828/3696_1 /ASSEMBLY_ACC=CAM_ASM_000867 /TAXON_ID=1034604 /ORGANISM="Chlamydomonas leiostraca, Strain SAG 11-49" /LENGTH=349 /DNA_ID=CAMNT_0049542361 /DNA_START=132 /DNA_END=1181 /DNA_ORIENTATION=-
MAFQLGPVIFPSPYATIGLTALAAMNAASALNEAKGVNLPYSKFAHASKAPKKYSGKVGMVIAYAGGLVCSAAGCAWLLYKRGAGAAAPDNVAGSNLPVLGPLIKAGAGLLAKAVQAGRPMLVAGMLLGHYVKREAEVALLHKYSGNMDAGSAWAIFTAYTMTTVINLAAVAAVPASLYADASASGPKIAGVPAAAAVGSALYVVGQAGNWYHHWLLARLRPSKPAPATTPATPAPAPAASPATTPSKKDKKGAAASPAPAAPAPPPPEKAYLAPKGGLFGQVVCPHYFFELVAWTGVAVASQHYQGFLTVGGMTMYLMGRSKSTHKWYTDKKIEGFPGNRKCLVPGLY